MITFEYKGRIYKPSNLDKKLKSMNITIDDIKIIDDTPSNNEIISNLRTPTKEYKKLYCFWDNKTKGWYRSECPNAQGWPFKDFERFSYIGQMEESETVEQAFTRLFKYTQKEK